MSFQQGLSGLNAATKSLEAIGNNVANANTVGFKSSSAVFADLYAASLSGGGSSDVGLGVRTALINQKFSQGNITGTGNPLDIAINGGGFFRMSNNGVITYGRNGQFRPDEQGFIVSPNGSRLTGYLANASGALATGVPQELQINAADLPPRQTRDIDIKATFDSRKSPPTTTPFSSADPTSYTNATSTPIYDSLGNEHILETYFVKTAANTWAVYAAVDGEAVGEVAAVPVTNPGPNVVATGAPTDLSAVTAGTFAINGISIGAIAAGATPAAKGANVAAAINAANIPGVTATADAAGAVTINGAGPIVMSMNGGAANATDAANNKTTLLAQTGFGTAQVGTQAVTATRMGTLNFTTSGEIDTATTVMPMSIPISTTSGSVTPFAVYMDFAGSQQFGSNFKVKPEQDGYAPGSLAGFNVGSDGIITGRYTNGKTNVLGQVILANFTNPNGLQPLGDNMWADTSESGSPLIGTPGAGNLGKLQSNAVEDSNVDLTGELVNMITAQRVYQANAQTIKTQDQVLQTLLNMR